MGVGVFPVDESGKYLGRDYTRMIMRKLWILAANFCLLDSEVVRLQFPRLTFLFFFLGWMLHSHVEPEKKKEYQERAQEKY